jgi:hypothetical protein
VTMHEVTEVRCRFDGGTPLNINQLLLTETNLWRTSPECSGGSLSYLHIPLPLYVAGCACLLAWQAICLTGDIPVDSDNIIFRLETLKLRALYDRIINKLDCLGIRFKILNRIVVDKVTCNS